MVVSDDVSHKISADLAKMCQNGLSNLPLATFFAKDIEIDHDESVHPPPRYHCLYVSLIIVRSLCSGFAMDF
jgi:hypothetical protein